MFYENQREEKIHEEYSTVFIKIKKAPIRVDLCSSNPCCSQVNCSYVTYNTVLQSVAILCIIALVLCL